MSIVLFVVAVVALAVAYALRLPKDSEVALWVGIGAPYVVLALIGAVRLSRQGRLAPLLRFRRGDPTIGIVIGFVLLGMAWLIAKFLLPAGAPQRAWLLRVFLLVADSPEATLSLMLLLLVLGEELVWRGWVQSELRDLLGARRAWMACAGLYAAAHAPTLFTLDDPSAGKNPLVLLAALGVGSCFSFLTERSGRLSLSIFAHAVFSYFAAQSFWLFV